jgi:hypothetical protein
VGRPGFGQDLLKTASFPSILGMTGGVQGGIFRVSATGRGTAVTTVMSVTINLVPSDQWNVTLHPGTDSGDSEARPTAPSTLICQGTSEIASGHMAVVGSAIEVPLPA